MVRVDLAQDVGQGVRVIDVLDFLLLGVTHKHQITLPSFDGRCAVKLPAAKPKSRPLAVQRRMKLRGVGQHDVHSFSVDRIHAGQGFRLGMRRERNQTRGHNSQQPRSA